MQESEIHGYLYKSGSKFTVFKYKRSLDTTSSYPSDIVLNEKDEFIFCVVWGNSPTGSKAGKNFEEFYIQLKKIFKGKASLIDKRISPSSLKVHTLILYLVWLILVDIGLLVVKLCKHQTEYYFFHSIIMSIVTIITISLVILVLIENKARLKKIRFQVVMAHFILGVIFISSLIVELIMGVILLI